MISKRDFLVAMLGTNVIAVMPKQSTVPGSAPVLDPFAVEAPKGWTYQWVRSSIMGEPDPHNVQQRLDNGWTFVPTDRHPGIASHDLDTAVKGYGLILMQKPSAEVERSRAAELAKMQTLPFTPTDNPFSGFKRNDDGTWTAPEGFVFVGSSRDRP